ncbi:hypothetical protein BX616_006766 [Lobosporangium transversale]|uniref:Arrestin-like N-terminal domain-containing protein n=1 Tax=Lobosporangium transversale TaxID=64571 RepID=A0A1Y2GH92_9FUNG|nr:hypothetical protein BCR41DRAFT_358852 [Lobosporangium transversale]KAF9915163.1 hypothetical protein BX616_006766 [Lobosporangium transversale]ORZ09082.1 hypothetical protein BCR41DRAFT_358852 [Lobosporangium transversale]|eukprot:XP_021878709.1 hypothetical protein BCR41DRAFT_358852 [Lobosporangium transversale]
MSDPVSPFAFTPQESQMPHPHTHALAQTQSHTPDSSFASTFIRRHRRSSSAHSHNMTQANTPTASVTHATSSSSPTPPSHPEQHSTLAVTSRPMPKLFKVEIANNGDCKSSNPIFYPSDLIHGMVHLYLDKPMTLPALKIVFRGESNYPRSNQQDHLDHHMRRLFSVAMTLWGSREPLPEDQWGQLPAGNHIFPFTIQLPDKNLPASFDHPWLKNQYTLTAYYRRPNGLSKWQSKAKPINFMPLSTPGLEHGPIQESCPKMGTALLLSHPDLTPGGRVHVKLTAAAAIDRCHFSLSRHIRARINETTYKEDEVICHYERKSIPKGEFNLVLPIPKITPPTTESSAALKITYSVQVSIWNERFFFKTESHNFDIPIVIRTLPSCDNRACEGLDWCEPSVDRPMFLTEEPMQPLPLYDAEPSPPKYTLDLPSYNQVLNACSSAVESIPDSNSNSNGNDNGNGNGNQNDPTQNFHHTGHENDQDDRASTHSTETTNSDVEGHARTIPDHPHPHHPSCVYYVAPLDRLEYGQTIECQGLLSPPTSSSSNHSSSNDNTNTNNNSDQHALASTSSSCSLNQDTECHPHTIHPRAVDFFKVHTIIEPA